MSQQPIEQQPGEFAQAEYRARSDEYGRGAWNARDIEGDIPETHDCGEDTCCQVDECCRHRGTCDCITEEDYEDGDPDDTAWLE